MPLLSILRLLASVVSLAVLGVAVWLLWTWGQGEAVLAPGGELVRERDDWRLWTGGGLLLLSFGGRFLLPRLVARPGGRPTGPERAGGVVVAGRSGSSLYVELHGPEGAPPIIFTHGWGMDSTFWRYAREDFSGRFRLTLWDLPGLGRSRPRSSDAVALSAFAEDLAGLIEQSGPGRPVLVGHSIGGMTIQTLVREHPELQARLAGIVLLNTTHTNPLRTMILSGLMQALRGPVLEPAMRLTIALSPLVRITQWQSYLSGASHLANRFGFGPAVTRRQLEHATLLVTRNSPGVQARGNLAMFHWDATEALDSIRVPTLVLAGDRDIITKAEASQRIAGSNPLVRLEVIEAANHLGPLDRYEVYNRLIANFVLAVQPAAGGDIRRSDAPDRPAFDRPAQGPEIQTPGPTPRGSPQG